MRYIGNKTNLLDFIFSVVEKNNLPKGVFCDIFSGTANVAKFFKRRGYQIISNDFMHYSYIFQMAYVHNNSEPSFKGLSSIIPDPNLHKVLSYLNGLNGEKDFIYNNYCIEGSSKTGFQRNYFSPENAMKIDSVRNKITYWFDNKLISEDEYYILLTSLLEFIPSISNISGTYGAFLKINDPRMFKRFVLKAPDLIKSNLQHSCFNCDGNELIRKIKCNILYIDPPYNHRQYAPNYHILESVAVWDKKIKSSKTGLRPYENQISEYCSTKSCVKAFEDLIKNAQCDYILFSYNTEGIIPEQEIKRILDAKGTVEIYNMPYRRFKSHSNGTAPEEKLKELVYFVKVTN